MKYFGAGTAIVPIVGGAPVDAARAVLVKPPIIEPPKASIVKPLDFSGPLKTKLTIEDHQGHAMTYSCMSMILDMNGEVGAPVDMTTPVSAYRTFIPGTMNPTKMTFEVLGPIETGDVRPVFEKYPARR